MFRSSTDEMNNAAANANRGYLPRDPPPFRGLMGPRGYERYVVFCLYYCLLLFGRGC